jgi:hypothetical protein
MKIIMTLQGKEFIELDIDFKGKDTVEARQQYQEEVAGILEKEYEEEIELSGPAEFYCLAGSRMQFMEITNFDLLQLDIKLKAARFLKQQKTIEA